MPNKVRITGSAKRIGEAIVQAWRGADNSVDKIDVAALRQAILNELNPNEQAGTGRVVDVGLIFDENLSRQTRFVWLAIPTPDVKRTNGADERWEIYINREFGTDAQLEELGESVLFGCGR